MRLHGNWNDVDETVDERIPSFRREVVRAMALCIVFTDKWDKRESASRKYCVRGCGIYVTAVGMMVPLVFSDFSCILVFVTSLKWICHRIIKCTKLSADMDFSIYDSPQRYSWFSADVISLCKLGFRHVGAHAMYQIVSNCKQICALTIKIFK